MAKDQEIEFVIKPNGQIEMEMHNFEGKGCAEAAAEMIKKIGKTTESSKKPEFYQEKKTQTCQHRKV